MMQRRSLLLALCGLLFVLGVATVAQGKKVEKDVTQLQIGVKVRLCR